MTVRAPSEEEFHFAIADDPLYRLQRRLRLVPREGRGLVRRALFFALLTWLPLAIWAGLQRRLLPGDIPEPLLGHFGVHVRCLIGLPLFILAEGLATRLGQMTFRYFVESGIVGEASQVQFAATLRWAEKWRDSKIVWLGILGLVVSTILVVNPVAVDAVCQAWLGDGTRLTFGAVWFRWVMRPVFLVFALAWVWRVVVLTLLLRGISKLDLQLVPSHPDRCGGLGFLETLPLMFAPVILAAASVAAGRMAHEVLYHGVHVAELKSQAAVGAIVLVAFFLMPLIVIGAPLRRLRVMGRLDYSKLAGRQARAIHSRWIRGETVQEDGVLSAPELGPAADVATLYTNAASVRSTVIGRVSILAVLAPILLPALIVASLEVPIKQILLKLMGAFT